MENSINNTFKMNKNKSCLKHLLSARYYVIKYYYNRNKQYPEWFDRKNIRIDSIIKELINTLEKNTSPEEMQDFVKRVSDEIKKQYNCDLNIDILDKTKE